MKTCPNASSVLINFHSRAVMEITSSETGKNGKKEGTEWGGRRRKGGKEGGNGGRRDEQEHCVMKHYQRQKTDNTSQ